MRALLCSGVAWVAVLIWASACLALPAPELLRYSVTTTNIRWDDGGPSFLNDDDYHAQAKYKVDLPSLPHAFVFTFPTPVVMDHILVDFATYRHPSSSSVDVDGTQCLSQIPDVRLGVFDCQLPGSVLSFTASSNREVYARIYEVELWGHCEADSTFTTPEGTFPAAGIVGYECQLCPAGFLCDGGFSRTDCGAAPSYCPEGSLAPLVAADGMYVACSDDFTSCSDTQFGQALTCPIGHKCLSGKKTACEAGYFALGGASSCDPCPSGSYCPGGQSPITCPSRAKYCPALSEVALDVPIGHEALGCSSGGTGCSFVAPCAATFYCDEGKSLPCPGTSFYCPANSSTYYPVPSGYLASDCSGVQCANTTLCPAGSMCSGGDSESCSSDPSIFCPEGSSSGTPVPDGFLAGRCPGTNCGTVVDCPANNYCQNGEATPCSSLRFYCPAGSDQELDVPAGFYATDCDGVACASIRKCPPGRFCISGKQILCPAGTYGNATGLSTLACSGTCLPGTYCKPGSTRPLPCDRRSHVCPDGTGMVEVLPGHYATGCDVHDACTGSTICPSGSFCVSGEASLCPLGRFGESSGLSTLTCSGMCPAGFFCPRGTVFPEPCGSIDVFCPGGVGAPTLAEPGTYTDGGDATTRKSAEDCPPGSWCSGGVLTPCPAGTFSDGPSRSSNDTCVTCPPGFFCGVGSSVPRPCGDDSVYCPTGSTFPVQVDPGFRVSGLPGQRSSQTLCSPGSFCPGDGASYQCPEGFFGAGSGTVNATCDGRCHGGFYCPPGSTSPEEEPCGLGMYCLQGVEFECPFGTYRDVPGASLVDDCTPCPADTYGPWMGSTSVDACPACTHWSETSPPGSRACPPGVVAVFADDPEPVFPGLSAYDTLTVFFSQRTNRPSLTSTADVLALVNISAPLSTEYSAEWLDGGAEPFWDAAERLVLTLGETVATDPRLSLVSSLRVSVLPSGNLTDLAGWSAVADHPDLPVDGIWGESSTPQFLSTNPIVIYPYGPVPGVDAGDVLLFRFNQPVAPVPVDTTADLDALLEFTPPVSSWAADYTGRWSPDGTTLLFEVLAPLPSLPLETLYNLTAGRLEVAVLPSGGLTSLDESSAPSNATAVVQSGSWGDVPCNLRVDVYSWQALRVSFGAPPSGLPPTDITLEWSPDPAFPSSVTSRRTVSLAASSVVLTGLNTSTPLHIRAALVRTLSAGVASSLGDLPLIFADVATGCECPASEIPLTAVTCEAAEPPTFRPRFPDVTTVTLPTSTLSTDGSDPVLVAGQFLGLDGGVVWASYSGGSLAPRSYADVPCTVLTPGLLVECASAPGVGGPYVLTLTVDGGDSQPDDAHPFWYSQPTINLVAVNGSVAAPTQGGVTVFLTGLNFGPADADAVVAASARPSSSLGGGSDMEFVASGCRVEVDHTMISCVAPAGAGASVSWSVTVEALQSTLPVSSYLPPSITNLTSLTPTFSTLGGAVVLVSGNNFGPSPDVITVTAQGAVTVTATNCTMPELHMGLECTMPPGVGRLSTWSVLVLDQAATWSTPEFGYEEPVVESVVPNPLPTAMGLQLTVSGSGFGMLSSLVTATAQLSPAVCGGSSGGASGPGNVSAVPDAIVPVDAVVLSDGGLTVSLPPSGDTFYVGGQLVVEVAGQTTTWPLAVAPPSPDTSLQFATRRPNATHFFIDIVGTNFGQSAGDPCRLSVDIDGTPCDELVMVTPHEHLLCTTTLEAGALVLTTPTGSVSLMYASDVLAQPPAITSITPSVWATTEPTRVSILGVRFGSLSDGVTAVPLRLSPSSSASGACPSLPPVLCSVDGPDLLYSNELIVCELPPGVGDRFEFLLLDTWLDPGAGYRAPTLSAATPAGGVGLGPAGGVLNITGHDLGLTACGGSVTLALTPAPASPLVFDPVTESFSPPLPPPEPVPMSIVSWSPNLILVTVPSGLYDRSLALQVRVLGQLAEPAGGGSLILSLTGAVATGLVGSSPPTTGGSNVTVVGTGFGSPAWGVGVRVNDADCPVLSHNDTHVVCTAPAGAGVANTVKVYTPFGAVPWDSPSSSSSSSPLLAYQAPVIGLISSVPAAHFPVIGNFTLRVTGRNLHPAVSAVTVDGLGCPVTRVDAVEHRWLECLAPEGGGAAVLEVDVGTPAIGSQHDVDAFLYNAPVITDVSPSPLSTDGGLSLKIHGTDLGNRVTPTQVLLGDVPCPDTLVISDTEVRCLTTASVVARQDVVLTFEGLTGFGFVDRMCDEGTYGTLDEPCQPCPTGAVCPAFLPEPIPLPGFHRVSRDEFLPCTPTDACRGVDASSLLSQQSLGLTPIFAATNITRNLTDVLFLYNVSTGECSTGYSGTACDECLPDFYRLESECLACPKAAYLYIAGVVIAAALFIAAAAYAHKKRINMSALGVFVDFAQIVSIFTAFDFRWPEELLHLFNAASFTTMNDQVMAPECSVSAWTFELKWFLVQGLPLIFVIPLAVLMSIVFLKRSCMSRRAQRRAALVTGDPNRTPTGASAPSSPTSLSADTAGAPAGAPAGVRPDFWTRILDVYSGVVIIALYFMYMLLVRVMLSAFDCTEVEGSDGIRMLDVDPSIQCDEPDGIHERIKPWAIASVFFYAIGIPLAFLVILMHFRKSIVADQTLRSKGTGNSRALNPHFRVRQRFQKLYSVFKPSTTFWRLVLLARKFSIAGVAIMFNKSPMFQACLSVGIVFISYALHVHFLPFLDHLDVEGEDVTSRAHVQKEGAVLSYTFKYNLLEATYLITAMFILLSGMAFESSLLEPGTTSYKFLTYLVATVLVLSVCLFCTMMAMEIFRSLKHARAIHLAKKRRTTLVKTNLKEASLRRRGSRPAVGPDGKALVVDIVNPSLRSGGDDGGMGSRWQANPMKVSSSEDDGDDGQGSSSRGLLPTAQHLRLASEHRSRRLLSGQASSRTLARLSRVNRLGSTTSKSPRSLDGGGGGGGGGEDKAFPQG